MRFCVVLEVPKKSGVARLFKVFATAVLANFQDRLVMTTSISFRLYKADLNFLTNFIYYILNKNKNQMIEAIFQTFLSIAAFYNFVNSFNELVF